MLGFLVFSILPPRHDAGHTLRTISLGVVMLLVLDAFCTIPPRRACRVVYCIQFLPA